MSSFKDVFLKRVTDSLYNDGMRILSESARTNETTKRSGNMEDAYGCAVYYNGNRIRTGYYNQSPVSTSEHHGWEKHGIQPNTGRGYLDDFFNSYKPKTRGMIMICVNAVYYTPILEDGAQGRPKIPLSTKYRIISQVGGEFSEIAKKYRGRVYNLREM